MSYSTLGAQPVQAKVNRISRFTIGADNQIVAGSEIPIYEWTHQRAECCHTGGSLDFGPDGSLYLSTGDNTNPFGHGYNPTDERAGRQNWDAQRTSANTNSPNGKILRILPRARADGLARRRARRTTSPRATCSRPAPPRRCPRSTRWASATRSGSTSTR